MKISLNWLKRIVKINISDDDLIRLIGARLVEVEGVIDETHKYDKIFVAKVASAEKIPDTHLTLCQIDVGDAVKDLPKVMPNDDGTVQVVCGAPNVREGMLAAWIAPGAVVPASVHEAAPFLIGKRKMLGKYESNGMLAGADELDFGDDHSGIVEINPDVAKPGDGLSEIFDLNDLILEIENKSLTHRPDCFGMIGFAREVAGILGTKFDYELDLEHYIIPKKKEMGLTVKIADAGICKRYTVVVLEKHGELKKKYLTMEDVLISKSGMRPVEPIVDATNYLMLLTGQPLHAFDYDKFVAVGKTETPEIVVRLAKSGEKLTLLDGKEIELNENDIVIASGEIPVALAGAMGGIDTEITKDTRNIILESATFSLYNLRKTQMAHGIFSEAITRFTKGQPPYQTFDTAMRCSELLKDGFKVAAVVDEYKDAEKEVIVKVAIQEINGLLGTEYDESLIVTTLANVGFQVKEKNGALEVVVPNWRTDIHIKEDVIEEVGRLLGYDNIMPMLPLHTTAVKNPMFELKKRARDIMSKFGANEVLTYSFVSDKLLNKAAQDKNNSYEIVNSISPELQYVRQSIVPSLLEKTYMNQKIPFNKFALFEINKVYQKKWGMNDEGVPVEKMRMGFVVAERKTNGTAFYKAKMYATRFLEENNIVVDFVPLKSESAEARPFEPKRAAEIVTADGNIIGVVGEFKNSVRRNFKLAEYLAGFELDMDRVLEKAQHTKAVKVIKEHDTRDLTIATEKTYGEVVTEVEKVLAKNNVVAKITPLAIYQPETIKHISLHLEFDQKIDEAIMQELETI